LHDDSLGVLCIVPFCRLVLIRTDKLPLTNTQNMNENTHLQGTSIMLYAALVSFKKIFMDSRLHLQLAECLYAVQNTLVGVLIDRQ
jgi:hypothetical protein